MTMNDLYFLHYDNNDSKSTALSEQQSELQKSARQFLETIAEDQKVQFKTCLREINFISLTYLSDEQKQKLYSFAQLNLGDHYYADQGLTFLIELLCGLKSRIVGETEIFGQFKKFYDALTSEQKIKFLPQSTMKFILESVKSLRDSHIKYWGAHSYGSLIRKLIKNYQHVDVIGFGHLAQEIEPWLQGKQVEFYVRNPEKAKAEALEKSLNVLIKDSLSEQLKSDVVILAAPTSSEFVLPRIQQAKLVIDCRAIGEQTQSVNGLCQAEVIELKDLFYSLENEQQKLTEKIKDVQNLIQNLIAEFSAREAHRPQGWYDLCL